ncbi:hypothetical protein P43SY_005044 [Pythium insidiosum]|uniref:Uncharacterized protein n=1 Tax=Pythium insidiosum TaxID=114742 RepID=A0AAD5QB24_PYTIN|nr:hypothetical protein P43SY_005044 [Pythium insidiosum]
MVAAVASSVALSSMGRAPPTLDAAMEQVTLLIQEWLTVTKFSRTLPCFVDECRERGLQATSVDKWVKLTELLDLTRLQADPAARQSPHHQCALLDKIVAHTFATHRKSKAKALLDQQIVGASKSTPALPPREVTTVAPNSVLRPKSAFVCKSTPELIAKTSGLTTPLDRVKEEVVPTKTEQNSPLPKSPIKSRSGGGHSPASSPVPKPDSPSKARPGSAKSPLARSLSKCSSSSGQDTSALPSTVAESGSASPLQSRSTSSRKLTLQSSRRSMYVASQDKPRRSDEPAEDSDDSGGADQVDGAPDTAFQPVLELEEMNEERLADHFSSLSRGTIKKLRRVLAKSNAHSQELERCRRAMEQIQQKVKQQEKRSVFAAEQTELLSSTMDMIIKEPCSLCRHVFLKRNLTTKVTFKSICDLRASWAAKKREEERRNGHQRHADKVTPPSREERPDEDEDDIQESAQLMDSSQISHLYDEVPVCVFCAQLLLDVSTYRPTSAQLRQRREEKRREALERHRQREMQRQQDALRCDPLDFDATRLNSDDDGSDTEEVLEYDDDGRVRVVRRPRKRRITRMPAQRGLVSKRLHYDQLRSQSVHALNRKEWGVIVSQSSRQVAATSSPN